MKNKTHFEEWLLWKSEAKIVISFIKRSLRRLRLKPMCISRLMCISRQSFRKIGSPSIAQIERLIGELQQAKNFLASERERIERETVRYIKFTQMASDSVKFIFNTLPGRCVRRDS